MTGIWHASTPVCAARPNPGASAGRLTDAQREVSSGKDGKLVAVPVTIGAIGAVWNDTAVKKSGLKRPTTWPEVLRFCRAAKDKGVVAFALGLKDAWVDQLVPYALTASLVYGPDPDVTQQQLDGKAGFATSRWKEAMDKYLDMRDAGCFNKSPSGTGYEEQMQLLGKGKTLGAVHVLSAVASAKQYATSDTTFSMTPFPATDNAGDTRLPVAVGISYAVNARARQPQLAREFIRFLASEEGQNIYATKAAAAPALPNASFKADSLHRTDNALTEQRLSSAVVALAESAVHP
ncbi:extracellular solute-binding protein [Streptomyces sparsogenes]|uniref:ABC transporter substrate-binding protein n=1 Tax=Streptomyces sparsogenes TaxID=67365 RepID=UPI0033E22459